MKTSLLFHEVVDAHAARVLRVCASVLGPGPDAEDAWAETFVAALEAYPFHDVENLEAWLARVARFKAVDILRAQRRTATRSTGDSDDSGDRPALAAGETVDFPEFDDELWGHVAALTERQQFVVAHRFIAQWTYPEIAEKLGCTPAAARRCGADAIATLRTRMFPAGLSHRPSPGARS